MREICFDTETTGLDPNSGHKLVEIGCVELINRVPSGNNFHVYLNPERDMPTEAFEVHGLSEAFLADKPLFSEKAQEFLDYLGDAMLVIHNSAFDMKFLNAELKSVGLQTIAMSRALDTVAMARAKFPGAPVSLDALCRRFGIDNALRTKHGALLDAELLADVYIELTGGRQTGLTFGEVASESKDAEGAADAIQAGQRERPLRVARAHEATPEEAAAHADFLKKINDPIWSS